MLSVEAAHLTIKHYRLIPLLNIFQGYEIKTNDFLGWKYLFTILLVKHLSNGNTIEKPQELATDTTEF